MLSHMAEDIRAIDCLYMPSEVCFWGSLLPDCYIVTNLSMLCLGKTKLSVCVCVREPVPGVHVHTATPVWDIFLVRCSVDMITLR